jgi:hypothetical protein
MAKADVTSIANILETVGQSVRTSSLAFANQQGISPASGITTTTTSTTVATSPANVLTASMTSTAASASAGNNSTSSATLVSSLPGPPPLTKPTPAKTGAAPDTPSKSGAPPLATTSRSNSTTTGGKTTDNSVYQKIFFFGVIPFVALLLLLFSVYTYINRKRIQAKWKHYTTKTSVLRKKRPLSIVALDTETANNNPPSQYGPPPSMKANPSLMVAKEFVAVEGTSFKRKRKNVAAHLGAVQHQESGSYVPVSSYRRKNLANHLGAEAPQTQSGFLVANNGVSVLPQQQQQPWAPCEVDEGCGVQHVVVNVGNMNPNTNPNRNSRPYSFVMPSFENDNGGFGGVNGFGAAGATGAAVRGGYGSGVGLGVAGNGGVYYDDCEDCQMYGRGHVAAPNEMVTAYDDEEGEYEDDEEGEYEDDEEDGEEYEEVEEEEGEEGEVYDQFDSLDEYSGLKGERIMGSEEMLMSIATQDEVMHLKTTDTQQTLNEPEPRYVPSQQKWTSTHVVTSAFYPTRPDEIKVLVGDLLQIHQRFEDGWVECTNVTAARKLKVQEGSNSNPSVTGCIPGFAITKITSGPSSRLNKKGNFYTAAVSDVSDTSSDGERGGMITNFSLKPRVDSLKS